MYVLTKSHFISQNSSSNPFAMQRQQKINPHKLVRLQNWLKHRAFIVAGIINVPLCLNSCCTGIHFCISITAYATSGWLTDIKILTQCHSYSITLLSYIRYDIIFCMFLLQVGVNFNHFLSINNLCMLQPSSDRFIFITQRSYNIPLVFNYWLKLFITLINYN